MIENIKTMFSLYSGSGAQIYIYLLIICILLYEWKKIDDRKVRFLCAYSIVMAIIFFFPLTAKVIMDFCIGRNVYWRVIWTWPIPLTLALFFTKIIQKMKKYSKIMIAAVTLLLVASGSLMYGNGNFEKVSNVYKLPDEIPQICEMIKEYADGKEMKAAVPAELASYIRQYDARIKMAYGREGQKEDKFDSPDAAVLYNVMNNKFQDAAAIQKASMSSRCNFLVLNRESTANKEIQKEGAERIGKTKQYYVYYLPI